MAKCWWHQAATNGIWDPVLFLPRCFFFLSFPFSYFLPYFIVFPILPLSSHVSSHCFLLPPVALIETDGDTGVVAQMLKNLPAV